MPKDFLELEINTSWIVESRGPKNEVSRERPYSCLIEKERSSQGTIDDTGTVFLANKECPFRCLMCDLWKNTVDTSISTEELLAQIKYAAQFFEDECRRNSIQIRQWKLYNSGNFFDAQAIPSAAFPPIIDILNQAAKHSGLSNLIIECHPKLIGQSCLDFADALLPQLEVAMGLETIHPDVLPRLNKQMSLDDFQRAVGNVTKSRHLRQSVYPVATTFFVRKRRRRLGDPVHRMGFRHWRRLLCRDPNPKR